MKYAKPALSVAEQLALLQRRGMVVNHEADAARLLQHVNYYRLRGYWLPFEESYAPGANHRFRTGTTFEQVSGRYTFDRQLRLLVLDAIERIEVSFRANWALVLALRHGPHAFEDPNRFWRQDRHAHCLSELDEELARSKETFVVHYQRHYDDPARPPVWAVCEVMTLGQLSKWLDNLKARPDRQAIAAAYGIDEQLLCSFAHHLSYVRNLCAHHARLYNRGLTLTFKLPRRPAPLAAAMNPRADRRLYNTLATMQYLMARISPGHSWTARLFDLLDQHPDVSGSEMGFPEDWRQREVWAEGRA
ncbi:MAG: Abi family protein [Rubrivivax sp.]|nr:Abi family protein [Rubrivivax sp.]